VSRQELRSISIPRRKFTPLSGIDFNKEKLPRRWAWWRFDFDKDGWMDLAFTQAGAPGISLWGM